MEIYYWLLFFSIMIFISLFSWVELLCLFVGTIMFLGGAFNYEKYSNSDNWFLIGISNLVSLSKVLWDGFCFIWDKFTSNTLLGNYIFRFFVYLENNYQLIKVKIKQQILKQTLNNFSLSSLHQIRGTPRLSNDDDDTDDE